MAFFWVRGVFSKLFKSSALFFYKRMFLRRENNIYWL